MKANAQYNDFTGTSAADSSDHLTLNDFLKSRNVDVVRYEPIGASFYHGYSDFFTAYIICIDNHKSDENQPYLVNMHFEKELSATEFFNLFKRFHVIVTKKHAGYNNSTINEEIAIYDREKE